jgi:mono/diheme cytochrome c family protein
MRRRLPPSTIEGLIVLGVLTVALAGAIAGISVWLVDEHSGRAEAAVTETGAAETQPAQTQAQTAATETQPATQPATTQPAQTQAPQTEAATTAAGEGNAQAGAQVFATAGCGGCHTLAAAGSSGTVGPSLDDVRPSFDTVVQFVTNGSGPMPAFGRQGILNEQQILDVAAYVVQSTSG